MGPGGLAMGTQSRANGALPTWAEADWRSWGRASPGGPWSTPPPTPATGCPPVQLRPGPRPSLTGKPVATWLFFQNNLPDSASLKPLAVILRKETTEF